MSVNNFEKDLARLHHMIDAIHEALRFIKNKTEHSLKKDRKLLLSLTKEIEIVGEAANKISASFRKKHSDVEWDIIVTTRNRLIHGYFDIDPGIIWDTISVNLPELLKKLKKIQKEYEKN